MGGYVACMGEMKNSYEVLIGKLECKKSFVGPDLHLWVIRIVEAHISNNRFR
jgi:hypothetical protein